MTTAAWPTLSKLPDQKDWEETPEDPGIKSQMDGGYVVSRARYTRAPRHVFKFQMTDMSNTDKLLVQTLWNTVRGSSDIFTFPHPFDGNVYTVRFNKQPSYKYADFATLNNGNPDHHWNITGIELEEA